jgi:3-hydroxypropanoate dehydrogenase
MRVVFVKSRAAKERLKPALSPGNLDKTMAAPVTAITAYDVKFYEHLPFLMPRADAKSWFDKLPAEQVREVAHKNGTLQVAYLIIALRALGLDTGPMTGFDNEKLDAEFFPDGRFRSNVLINIGYGDHTKLFPRSPRFAFDEIAKIV